MEISISNQSIYRFGLLKLKLNQPTILPIVSVKASCRLLVVNILLNLINVNNITITFHLNLAFN